SAFNLEKDVLVTENGKHAESIAWNHRKSVDADIYFVANQEEKQRTIDFSFRVQGKVPYAYQAVTGEFFKLDNYQAQASRTELSLNLAPNQSVFIIFGNEADAIAKKPLVQNTKEVLVLNNEWKLAFDESYGGPKEAITTKNLFDWTTHELEGVKHYSGTVKY